MPTGKHVSEERKTVILRLHDQGLSAIVIGIRTGLHADTIHKIIKKGGSNEISRGTRTERAGTPGNHR